MSASILITGATGNVGAEVIRQLQHTGQSVRVAVRHANDTHFTFGAGIESVLFDFAQPATFQLAFESVERIFLMRPPAISNVRHYIFPAIDAAKRAGVRQIVFLSLIGVEKNRVVPHYKIEQYILSSGLDYTFLRPSFFMQNLSTTHRDEIRDRSEIFVPAGDGKTSFIDVRDIAAVASLALVEAGHTNAIYELTGDEALSYAAVAGQLSSILGRTIVYPRPSLLQFIRRQREQGSPWPRVVVMSGIYTTARLGLAGHLTGDVRRLLGRPPITFQQFAKDHAACWQRSGPPAISM
jgi:uncharacterized protein YbjT (DUF2867 family)